MCGGWGEPLTPEGPFVTRWFCFSSLTCFHSLLRQCLSGLRMFYMIIWWPFCWTVVLRYLHKSWFDVTVVKDWSRPLSIIWGLIPSADRLNSPGEEGSVWGYPQRRRGGGFCLGLPSEEEGRMFLSWATLRGGGWFCVGLPSDWSLQHWPLWNSQLVGLPSTLETWRAQSSGSERLKIHEVQPHVCSLFHALCLLSSVFSRILLLWASARKTELGLHLRPNESMHACLQMMPELCLNKPLPPHVE